jgi:two-component system phosphate regulon sensor histidine kinase PhoR
MFLNLFRNAVTYGREGGQIEISAQRRKDLVKIKISDNGIGIPEKDLPHIFERFYRANKSHVKETQSVGLGLAIVKWIVTAHKGSISVKSEEGKGTTFTISLRSSN